MSEEYSLDVLVRVLNKVLMPGAQISEDNVNILVKFITGLPENLLDRNSLCGILDLWFSRATELWTKELPHPAILTLALNIAVFLACEEYWFLEMHQHETIEKFIKILKSSLRNMDATPDVGYIKLISCFLNHKAGTSWLITTTYWYEIVALTVRSENESDIKIEGTNFISKLMLESSNVNSEFSSKLIHIFLSPTIDFAQSIRKRNTCDEKLFNENCISSLNVFQYSIESLLDGMDSEKCFTAFKQIVMASKKYQFESHIMDICRVSSSDDICFELMNIIYFVYLLEVFCSTKDTPVITLKDYEPLVIKFEMLRKKFSFQLLKVYPKLIFRWVKYNNKIREKVPKVIMKDGTIVACEDTLIFYQLIPMGYISFNITGTPNSYFDTDDELRTALVTESLKKMLPEVYYQFYGFRDYMDDQFSFDYVINSLEYVLKSVNYYSRKQATMLVKILIYCFEDFSKIMSSDSKAITADALHMRYFGLLIKTIQTIISQFDLNWQDTLESITLMEILLSVISQTEWSTEVIVNGLELISVAFSKHLSLNMAFLTDQFDGDVIEKIIEICIQKMNNESNEIRSSAIKVIESISNNVNKDFSSFKPLILENYLPVRIFEMAVHDQDPNVRAAAVRCLQEMASVEDFWNYILQSYDIYDQVCQTLFEEYHHIVRSETATLVAIIYQQHDFSPELLMKFYDTMSYTATEDTHPSVRRNALQYWKNVIQNHLSLQGMIDGAFPDVTFSKESRKIVILNDIAVKKRLVKVLYQLSETGCLAVLKTSLEDADEEVRKTSKDIVSDFYDLLTKYEVIIHDIDCYEPARCRDSFCDTNDILEKELNCKLKGRNILQPEIFLDFVKTYFMPNQSTAEACQRPIIETVLKEILCDNYSHGLS